MTANVAASLVSVKQSIASCGQYMMVGRYAHERPMSLQFSLLIDAGMPEPTDGINQDFSSSVFAEVLL
ncbi:uncharacterized protein N7483_009649 [Penicillium malachiteum]|uniref:uncharacterized protein n=1 Tax=Penicillium malachiteum TaxID=1324776 RepID=UPI0025492A4A|nr:uncharacterized protein N7483_009649 [Penicillium malachiteum]KAJ5721715.1 hypothetical protein N7483_009649 [Penicillium malachiteum]